MGQPSENFAAARTCCASRFVTLQLEHECQLMPFLFVRPKSGCYCQGSFIAACFDHFFGPVLGAMMKQVCWHSPCHCSDVGPLEAIAENKT